MLIMDIIMGKSPKTEPQLGKEELYKKEEFSIRVKELQEFTRLTAWRQKEQPRK